MQPMPMYVPHQIKEAQTVAIRNAHDRLADVIATGTELLREALPGVSEPTIKRFSRAVNVFLLLPMREALDQIAAMPLPPAPDPVQHLLKLTAKRDQINDQIDRTEKALVDCPEPNKTALRVTVVDPLRNQLAEVEDQISHWQKSIEDNAAAASA